MAYVGTTYGREAIRLAKEHVKRGRSQVRPLLLNVLRACSFSEALAEGYLDGFPLIDVRSPGEFLRGHVPGAFCVPLFSNEERAVVGTLYKQKGRDSAVLEGLRIVGPKMAPLVEKARSIAPDGRTAVHCWRGGERSKSVAWLLDKAGFQEVIVITGGYRSIRNHVRQSFSALPELRVIGGYTGTGKTRILQQLSQLGEQVVDLEHLAQHKGSSFGMLGQGPQPSQEQFENLLWNAFRALDRQRTVWIEDESRSIGMAQLPREVFTAIRSAQVLFVDMPRELRVERLVAEYGSFPKADLEQAIIRIAKRLGPQHAKHALEALAAGDLATVAKLTLNYYDKTYAYGLSQRDPAQVERLPVPSADPHVLAQDLKNHVTTHAAKR